MLFITVGLGQIRRNGVCCRLCTLRPNSDFITPEDGLRSVPDDDVAEDETHRITEGTQTALEARAEELLQAAAVDLEGTEARRDMPDMGEGDHGKLAAPAKSQRDAAQDGKHIVAAVLSALEAAVGDRPHAVDAMGAVWFGQHVFKAHLKQTEDVSE